MSRWIDADAFERTVMFSDDEDLQDVIYRLRDYPSIDIVRCKECKYKSDGEEFMWCDHMKGMDMVNADDFCSYGERRE